MWGWKRNLHAWDYNPKPNPFFLKRPMRKADPSIKLKADEVRISLFYLSSGLPEKHLTIITSAIKGLMIFFKIKALVIWSAKVIVKGNCSSVRLVLLPFHPM
jgi:hypothetical protein